MPYVNLEEIFAHAKKKGRKNLAVAAAHDLESLKAVIRAQDEGAIDPLLVGDTQKIKEYLETLGKDPETYQIFEASNDTESAQKSVELVKTGQADFLMKGFLNISDLLRAVVNKETGLGLGRTISHINIMEIDGYEKLLIITDVGIVISPTLQQKKEIIENAVNVLRNMDYDEPKVAILAAVESVNPKMPETVDAAELQKMNEEGEIKHALVEGPISFDIALNKRTAEKKGYKGKIAGDPDILVVPSVVAGNILVKAIGRFGKVRSIAFVTGASVPIVLTSRGTLAEGKYYSILACIAAL